MQRHMRDILISESITGAAVTCVSKETQLAMHTGYTLPIGHPWDLELLHAG